MVKRKPLKKVTTQKPQRSRGPVRESTSTSANTDDQLPQPLQQNLLNIFKDACIASIASDFDATLQEVKGHLYKRDFATAFGKDEYLQAYAARWSPSRALGYAHIFRDLENFFSASLKGKSDGQASSLVQHEILDGGEEGEADLAAMLSARTAAGLSLEAGESGDIVKNDQSEMTSIPSTDDSTIVFDTFKVACVGGGAGAEIVGLAGWLDSIKDEVSGKPETTSTIPKHVDVLCLDIARWDKVVEDLYRQSTTPPTLSKYASAAAQAANAPFISADTLGVQFLQQDVLNITTSEVSTTFADQDLVTIMFTLNELYAVSVAKAQRFLYNLTASMREGSLLLFVDSPGSYSAVTINGAEKKYPMQWLLDHTLLEESAKKNDPIQGKRWEKLVSDESRWFRLQEDLDYPIDLENMRYQIHLYRRCGLQS